MAERIAREADGHLALHRRACAACPPRRRRAGEERAARGRAVGADRAALTRRSGRSSQVVAVAGGPSPARRRRSRHVHRARRPGARRRAFGSRTSCGRAGSGGSTCWIIPRHDRVRAAVLGGLDDDIAPDDPPAGRDGHRGLRSRTTSTRSSRTGGARKSPRKPRATRSRLWPTPATPSRFDRAARMYNFALSCEPELEPAARSSDEDVRAIRTNLAIALVNAGRGAEAADAFLLAAEGAVSRDESIDLRRRGAEQLLFSGHFDRGLEVLHEVLAAMGMEVPADEPEGAPASLLVRRGTAAPTRARLQREGGVGLRGGGPPERFDMLAKPPSPARWEWSIPCAAQTSRRATRSWR